MNNTQKVGIAALIMGGLAAFYFLRKKPTLVATKNDKPLQPVFKIHDNPPRGVEVSQGYSALPQPVYVKPQPLMENLGYDMNIPQTVYGQVTLEPAYVAPPPQITLYDINIPPFYPWMVAGDNPIGVSPPPQYEAPIQYGTVTAEPPMYTNNIDDVLSGVNFNNSFFIENNKFGQFAEDWNTAKTWQ